jgi:hypothetical protein
LVVLGELGSKRRMIRKTFPLDIRLAFGRADPACDARARRGRLGGGMAETPTNDIPRSGTRDRKEVQ